jgi:hypothetical protein
MSDVPLCDFLHVRLLSVIPKRDPDLPIPRSEPRYPIAPSSLADDASLAVAATDDAEAVAVLFPI